MTKKATAEKKDESDTSLVSVQERIRKRIENMDKTTGQVGGKNISTKGSKFTLPDGTTSDGPLNCVIVDYINNNAWYKEAYVEGGPITPPDCFSVGREIDSLVPHPTVEEPVNADCKTCEKNEYGSRGRGKECSNNVKLAILPENFKKDSEVYTIKVAPKGLKAWTEYVRTLEQRGVDPVQVVTSISFVPGLAFPQLKFKALGGNDQLDEVGPFMPSADILLS